jgi:hypothetical protein
VLGLVGVSNVRHSVSTTPSAAYREDLIAGIGTGSVLAARGFYSAGSCRQSGSCCRADVGAPFEIASSIRRGVVSGPTISLNRHACPARVPRQVARRIVARVAIGDGKASGARGVQALERAVAVDDEVRAIADARGIGCGGTGAAPRWVAPCRSTASRT